MDDIAEDVLPLEQRQLPSGETYYERRQPLTPSTAEKFQEFHENNHHVYEVLVRLAREWVSRTGRRRIGIAALFERARWELSLQTTETPRLNNTYRAFYARLIMACEPDLNDVFETRHSAADETQMAA